MIVKRIFIVFLTLQLVYIKANAQLGAISSDSVLSEKDSLIVADGEKELFPSARGYEISIERNVPVFVSVNNNPLFRLIQKRVTVCLPLDYLTVNSRYGYRKDPVYRCERFHDGIDLKCNYGNVYSMMPGIVKEVHYGNKGYGNYVILQHGSIECLYGHLSLIAVNENDVVQAGDIVAISGNTGKSTGPHLHYAVYRHGRAINPSSIKVASTKKIESKYLEDFNYTIKNIDKILKDHM